MTARVHLSEAAYLAGGLRERIKQIELEQAAEERRRRAERKQRAHDRYIARKLQQYKGQP